jgi:signal transduction histidine kinase
MTGSNRIRIPDHDRHRSHPDDSVSLLRHDLCTPLNAILGFADLLAECEQLSAQHRRYAANIFTAGTDLLRTVNALVDQARVEGGIC